MRRGASRAKAAAKRPAATPPASSSRAGDDGREVAWVCVSVGPYVATMNHTPWSLVFAKDRDPDRPRHTAAMDTPRRARRQAEVVDPIHRRTLKARAGRPRSPGAVVSSRRSPSAVMWRHTVRSHTSR